MSSSPKSSSTSKSNFHISPVPHQIRASERKNNFHISPVPNVRASTSKSSFDISSVPSFGASTSNSNFHISPVPNYGDSTSKSNFDISPVPNFGASTGKSNFQISPVPSFGASTSISNVHLFTHVRREDELRICLPLYSALLRGNQRCFEQAVQALWPHLSPCEAMSIKITKAEDTALHVLVGAGNWFESLKIGNEGLMLRNRCGHTPLCVAAMVGNMKAAQKLLQLEMTISQIVRDPNYAIEPYPIIEATRYGHKEMVLLLIGDYLDRKMKSSRPTIQSPDAFFLHQLIVAGFYDVLLVLLRRYPDLAGAEFYGDESLLSYMAEKPSAFLSGNQLCFWQRLLYPVIQAKLQSRLADIGKSLVVNRSSTPHPPHELTWACFVKCPRDCVITIREWLIRMIRSCINPVGSVFKHIKDTKLMHEETLNIVKCLCGELMNLYYKCENIESVLTKALLLAASSGISEIIEEIIHCYPDAIWFANSKNQNIFQLAVINRHEKVFNLIYQLSSYKHLVIADREDTSGNNILHMVGKLAPPGRLNLISGAALQMQRELLWFQEVEKFVQPTFRTKKNSYGKTPKMVFTEEHKELVKEGEKWMKGTAKSCILVAALTATVGFAAMITVPGGNNQNSGFPLFSKEKAFTVFSVSVAFCTLFSIASVLMFLSILTSRYAEGDFLKSLPNRLIIGLIMLFVSLTSLMVAFGATIYLFFGQKKEWILISVGIVALMPVILFVFLQCPLLLDMFKSTYGRSIFHKQSSRLLY